MEQINSKLDLLITAVSKLSKKCDQDTDTEEEKVDSSLYSKTKQTVFDSPLLKDLLFICIFAVIAYFIYYKLVKNKQRDYRV